MKFAPLLILLIQFNTLAKQGISEPEFYGDLDIDLEKL